MTETNPTIPEKRRRLYDGDTFTHEGHTFRVTFPRDDDMGEPWKEHDGHGLVSDWTTREKQPGERILASDGRSHRYYDFAATVKLALKDGWGVSGGQLPGESKRAYAARATEADFEFCQGWCKDEWCWVGVVVELLDADGHKTGCGASLLGIESSSEDYLTEVAYDLTVEALDQIPAEAAALRAKAEKLEALR